MAEATRRQGGGGGLIGRAEELARLAQAVRDPGLVTLLGPGGVGKTRLATEFAARRGEAQRARFVWLDEVRSAEVIPGRLAQALELPSTGEGDLGRVAEALASSPDLLLVIDNAEHLVDAVREVVGRLPLSSARVLVTSRIPLDLPGERRFVVSELQPAEAEALLVQRASRFGVALDGGSCGPLIEALDGLPLAIELAAARTAILTPEQILERLQASNRILARRGDSRHGALDRTIAWSWELLDDEERALARTIAAFDHPLEPELVASLRPELDVFTLAQELEAKSWLRVVDTPRGKRWTTLRSIRRFVEGQTSSEQRQEQLDRLCGWARAHIEESPTWWSAYVPEGLEVADALEGQDRRVAALLFHGIFFGAFGGPLFLSVLERASGLAERMSPGEDPEVWSELATKIAKGSFRYASAERALAWSERALAAAPAGTVARLKAGSFRVLCLVDAARREEAVALLEEMAGERDALPQELSLAPALLDLATGAHDIGRFEMVRETGKSLIRIAREAGDADIEARIWVHLAYASYDLGEFERAEEELGRLVDLLPEPLRHEAPQSAGVIGPLVDLQRGRDDEALAGLRQLEERARAVGDQGLEFYVHVGLAEWAARHAPEEVREHLVRALTSAAIHASAKAQCHARLLLALDQVACGEFDGALARVEELRGEARSPACVVSWGQALEAVAWFCRTRGLARRGEAVLPAPDTPAGRLMAEAAAAVATGDDRGLRRLVAAAGAQTWKIPGIYLLRLDDVVLRWVERLAQRPAATGHRLILEAEGLRFRIDDGPVRDISRRGAARLILTRLARALAEAPGEAVGVEAIIAAGWPGEQILYESARTRVYTTMNRLRTLGVGEWLLTLDEGYALDPRLEVEWVEALG